MRASRIALWLTALGLGAPVTAAAHPMGNFSISHYAAIQVEPEGVRIRYVLDLAEIPTFQALQAEALPADPTHPAVTAYVARAAESLADELVLELDGERLPLRVDVREVTFPSGAGGLPTLRLGILYRAALPRVAASGPASLNYRDGNYPQRAGWKEIVATAVPGVQLLDSTVPTEDRSAGLTDYPADRAASPPQALQARVTFLRAAGPAGSAHLATPPVAPPDQSSAVARPGSPRHADTRPTPASASLSTRGETEARASEPSTGAAPPSPSATPVTSVPSSLGRTTPRDAFTALIGHRPLGVGALVLALIVAASLGAFHALEPGHGKTVVAAYLVGAHGTAWHACLLGLIVTASHTVGVYLLGAVTLYASQYVVPERLYPWLAAASGLLIVALGASLLWRRLTTPGATAHGHLADHDHAPHDAGTPAFAHGHDHGRGHHHHSLEGPVSLRSLVALGVSGGIVPCPAALVVLLSALAGRQVGLGLLLIVAFSVGLAAVLIGIGLLVVYARRLVLRFEGSGAEGPLIHRWLPLASAAVMTVAGLVITVQAFAR